MEKVYFLLINFLFFSFITHAGNPNGNNCEKFKKGTFLLAGSTYKIVRNETTQTEYNTNTGGYTTLNIKWITPCQYQLRFIVQHQFGDDIASSSFQKTILICNIIKTQGDSCFIVTTDKGNLYPAQSAVLVLQHHK